MLSSTNKPNNFGLIVGAMKCGTTSLFQCLSQHPQISRSREKEPGFFAFDETWEKGLDWYLDLWKWDPSRHRIALEASTHYTKRPARPNVPERIASITGAQFRFVYMMRNPISRIESEVRHGLHEGWAKSLDHGISEFAISLSRYAFQLDAFMRFFPREHFFLVILEEFQKNPETILEKIFEFLQLDESFESAGANEIYHEGRNQRAYTPLVAAALKSRAAALVGRSLIPRPVRQKLRRRLGREVKGRYRLTEAERALVVERLRTDLERLSGVYGVNVEHHWGISLR